MERSWSSFEISFTQQQATENQEFHKRIEAALKYIQKHQSKRLKDVNISISYLGWPSSLNDWLHWLLQIASLERLHFHLHAQSFGPSLGAITFDETMVKCTGLEVLNLRSFDFKKLDIGEVLKVGHYYYFM